MVMVRRLVFENSRVSDYPGSKSRSDNIRQNPSMQDTLPALLVGTLEIPGSPDQRWIRYETVQSNKIVRFQGALAILYSLDTK
jgi:hypothetical protein